MKSFRLAFALTLALTVSLTGCGGGGGASDLPRVGFVTNNREDFWKIAEVGAKKAAADEKVDLQFKMPDIGEVGAQKEIIKTLMSMGVKSLAISVISPEGQKDYLDEIAGKIPLITQDNDAPNTKRVCYIGTNNYEAGIAAGKLVKEAMPDGGLIVVFVGDLKPLNAQERRQGLVDELAGAKDTSTAAGAALGQKFVLYQSFTDQPQGPNLCYEKALGVITRLDEGLEKRPICMVGLWAYNPPAILRAVEKKDKVGKIKIVGFDENESTLKGIASGAIHGTIVQDPYGFGDKSVRMMAALVRDPKTKMPNNGILYVPHRVITKDGGDGKIKVDEFRAELDKLLGK